ncbi:MAG TPA: LutB/LldF family L-lactate oxidation iron-sulfur protein [Candidatus Koribacter sp.]|jgi:L-lactate dehydrogenase complex protein LldF
MSRLAEEFLVAAAQKSADLTHRATIKRNIDSYDAAVAKGKMRFVDWEAARARAAQVKSEGMHSLGPLLESFEAKIKARGGHVYWAENSEDARQYICDVAKKHDVKTVVKSKSMVTEEIHLSPALEKLGIKVWETDLGELIVQLRNEPPYHIVTPAMHLTREQIRDLFLEKMPSDVQGETHQELVAAARRFLRRAFFSAEMGISGANFLVADAGMVAISTNEGNGRLTTSLPKIHVVVTGIEKVIPRLEDLGVMWPVLATTGTGQPITTYSTLIGGPKTADEVDGPEEFHVVLVDNGRTEVLADKAQQELLRCIRCGACLNQCPVYRQVGGHTYKSTYPGPIGSALMPIFQGQQDYGHLSYACSLCTACNSVCPVKIKLSDHLLENRHKYVAEGNAKTSEKIGFSFFRWMAMNRSRYEFFGWAGRKALRVALGMGVKPEQLGPLAKWTKYRAVPEVPKESFRALWKKENGNGNR